MRVGDFFNHPRAHILREMRKPSVIIISILIVCGIVAAGHTLWVFTLRNDNTIIFLRVVKPKDTFLLKYLHSVALSDVWERFVIDNDYEFVLTETRFQGQGAGLPTSLSGNEKLTREGDWFKITGMNRMVPLIYWRVQAKWKNRLYFRNEPEMNLSRLLGDALILLEVEKMKSASWLYHRMVIAIDHLLYRQSNKQSLDEPIGIPGK